MALERDKSMLLDVQYVRGNSKKKLPDYLYMVWKDLTTLEKKVIQIPKPVIDIYFEKKEYRNHTYNKNYEHIEHLEKKTVRNTDVFKAIAEDYGDSGKLFLKNIYETGNFDRQKELFLDPYSFGADMDIRALYRISWLKELDNSKPKPLTKGFADIETDSIRIHGFTDALKDCPVDLITIIDRSTNTSYTFCLVDQQFKRTNPDLLSDKLKKREDELAKLFDSRHEQEQYFRDHIEEFKEELRNDFSEQFGDIDYKFYFFNSEAQLLVSFFQLVHKLRLDFIEFWNISFDIPYMIKRLRVLGIDPDTVIPDPSFPNVKCFFKEDRRHHIPKNKSDYFDVSGYTIYYDQMELYAAIRKSEKELRSVRLNDIARSEIKDEKLDYAEEGGNIKTLPYRNYWKYVKYNIKDVLLQVGIEDKCQDLDTLYVSSYNNATPYDQVFKQTRKLRNVQYISFLKQGLIPGNNINIFVSQDEPEEEEEDEDDDDPKFEGALVGNPLLIDFFGVKLYGSRTNSIFNYSIDMDMSAFYPNTIYTHNIDPSTLFFKAIIDASQFKNRGGRVNYNGITDVQVVPTNKDSFAADIAKEVFDNFQTRNYLSIGHKWNNLPSVTDMYIECEKRLGA